MRVKPRCARPGCTNPIQSSWFACKPDWYALPRDIRIRVFQCWQLGDFRHNPQYRDAVVDARKWWDRHPRPVNPEERQSEGA